jgi:anti-sigma regulatory factor (Ser/Thr protein kinase)
MGPQLTIVLKNDLAELERVSALLEEFGRQQGVPSTTLFELHLALDELLTNVVSYGYDDSAVHEIVVRLAAGPPRAARCIEVTVEDDARPFNPLEALAPDVEAPVAERPIGGLGIYLVRRVMDDLEYRREHGKNVLVMRKTVAG